MPITPLSPIVPNAPIVQGGGKKLRMWTYDEDQVLLRVVGDATWKETRTINWRQVCKVLSWRTPQQCRGRFRRSGRRRRSEDGRRPARGCAWG